MPKKAQKEARNTGSIIVFPAPVADLVDRIIVESRTFNNPDNECGANMQGTND